MLYNILKRTLDIGSSLFVLILFSPLIILISIAIKLDSPGPVFYKQKRVGIGGSIFELWKFRSMIPEADDFLLTHPKYLKDFKRPEGWKGGEASQDPRITRVGRFTRKYTLDELPQVWNVLTGDMSMVGPRAYRKDILGDEIEEQLKFHPHLREKVREALSVKPGLSGPWQVGGRNKIPWDQRVELDAAYAKRRNIFYDVLILFKTPLAMLNKW